MSCSSARKGATEVQSWRAHYAKVQDLFWKNKSHCAHEVLDGSWVLAGTDLTLSELEPFWHGIFETPSVEDNRTPQPAGPIQWGIVEPISEAELEETCIMKSKAPGPDGMGVNQLKQLPRQTLCARYNLWLMLAYSPSRCCMGVSTLIKKD